MCIICIYIPIYAYMFVTTINEKRGHEFKRKQGKVYGRIWKEERKGEMM